MIRPMIPDVLGHSQNSWAHMGRAWEEAPRHQFLHQLQRAARTDHHGPCRAVGMLDAVPLQKASDKSHWLCPRNTGHTRAVL